MKTRIISAAVAIAVCIVVLVFHDTYVLNAAVAFLAAVALYELLKCAGLHKLIGILAVSEVFALSVPLLWEPLYYSSHAEVLRLLVPTEIFVYVFGLFCCFLAYYKSVKYGELFFSGFETLFVTAALSTLLIMNEAKGLLAVILTLCAAWLADSGAYFAGTFLGKHKLCPNISPKKTVEGVIGGVLANGIILIAVAFVFSLIQDELKVNYPALFLVGCIAAVVGLVGDLTASLIKRQTGIKDYGNIMPGHGGVMDRFDSVLTVAPFMTIVFLLFDII